MSFLDIEDDICDFCGNFFDVSGSYKVEIAQANHWCGECREGRDEIWRNTKTADLIALRDSYQQRYDANPIDWSKLYQTNAKGQKVQAPLSSEQLVHYRQQFECSEMVKIINQVLHDRGH